MDQWLCVAKKASSEELTLNVQKYKFTHSTRSKMSTQIRQLDFSGQTIFIGLDVHLKNWRVSIYLGEVAQRTFHLSPPGVEVLESYLKRHYPGGQYKCAYEAGFSGFWIQEGLSTRGIETIVTHAADIPTTDKERQQKDDVRDSNKIARSLRNGDLEAIYIPDKGLQQDRGVVRERWRLQCDRKRVMNRIKSQLHFYGLYPEGGVLSNWRWSQQFLNFLAEQGKDKVALGMLLEEFNMLRGLERQAMAALRRIFKHERYINLMKLLLSVPGVGFLTAAQLLTEIGDMKRFKKFDELCFYVGLIPGTQSSGETVHADRRTSRGNKHLRTTLVESAWVAIRQDPELALSYSNLKKQMDGPHAIIKIARKLLNRIRRVWLSGQPYRIATA